MERFITILGILLSCAWADARDPLSEVEVASVIQEFQYENNYKEIENNQTSGNSSSCWVYSKVIEVQYSELKEPLRVNIQHYIPNRNRLGQNRVPAVIMLPPIGGMNMLDRKMAESFCSARISAVVLTDDFAYIDAQSKGSLRPPEDHHETFHRVGAGIKGSLAMMTDDANIQADKVGVFGVSLGGVLGSFMMATLREISAGYFIVAGGDIPRILAESQQEEVARIRAKRMRAVGLDTREQYEAYLREYILFDPIDMAKTMLPETLKMVISRSDTSVPTQNQMSLHRAFGEPDADYTNSGHVSTVISSLWSAGSRSEIARFFNKRFELPNPRPDAFEFLEQLYWTHAL